MPGYLDQYGEIEQRRAATTRRLKQVLLSLLVLLVVGGILYWNFKNYRQEQQVKRFFSLLQKQDYKPAYALWGCSETSPCRDYSFEKFLEDWGQKSASADASGMEISKSRSCGTGVIVTALYGRNRQEEKFWIERQNLVIGFSPWPGCPPFRSP